MLGSTEIDKEFIESSEDDNLILLLLQESFHRHYAALFDELEAQNEQAIHLFDRYNISSDWNNKCKEDQDFKGYGTLPVYPLPQRKVCDSRRIHHHGNDTGKHLVASFEYGSIVRNFEELELDFHQLLWQAFSNKILYDSSMCVGAIVKE